MSRECPICHKMHDTILEDKEGKRIHEFPKCLSCLHKWGYTIKPITEQIVLLEEETQEDT